MPRKTFLKTSLETIQFTDGTDQLTDDPGQIINVNKIYPAEWLMDESYHTLLTYAIMEDLKSLREHCRKQAALEGHESDREVSDDTLGRERRATGRNVLRSPR